MAGTDEWLTIAQSPSADDIRERILTGYKDGKPFTPYVPTVPLPRDVASVLDFGCGLGRNFPYLATIAQAVTGFDLPPMIERCRAVTTVPVELTSDWSGLSDRRFDLIFASLVLQHIEPQACAAVLRDFARMTERVYVITRADSDFGMRVEVVVPKEHLGDVMGNLSSRRGHIQSQEDRGGTQIINARVPLSEMFGYATDLRSRTQGRATYSMHFDRYEPAPQNVSEEVVARMQGK